MFFCEKQCKRLFVFLEIIKKIFMGQERVRLESCTQSVAIIEKKLDEYKGSKFVTNSEKILTKIAQGGEDLTNHT
jgi:hypothetical protein